MTQSTNARKTEKGSFSGSLWTSLGTETGVFSKVRRGKTAMHPVFTLNLENSCSSFRDLWLEIPSDRDLFYSHACRVGNIRKI